MTWTDDIVKEKYRHKRVKVDGIIQQVHSLVQETNPILFTEVEKLMHIVDELEKFKEWIRYD